MAIIKPEQLKSGFYQITGSFFGTASYSLTSSYAENAGSSHQITIGSVTASVDIGPNIFLITSGSSTPFTINNQGSTTISSSASDIFLIKNTIGTNILVVSQSGVIVLSTQSVELTGPAPNGGMYFTSGSFFVGID